MRTVTIILLVWLCFGKISAQLVIEKHIPFSGKESVILDIQIADSITLHTWGKNEVFVTASISINENKDNDAYFTSFDETGNSVVIKGKFRDNYFKGNNNCCIKSDVYWQVFIPEKTEFDIETINANITIDGQTEKIKVRSISGYIDLSASANRQADIEFSTITGTIFSNYRLALSSKNGGISTVIKEKLNNGGSPIKLETISGDIFFRKSN
jgi:hypothetical protein